MFLIVQVFAPKNRDGVFDLIVHMIRVHCVCFHDISSLGCIENFAADVTSRQHFQYQEILAEKRLSRPRHGALRKLLAKGGKNVNLHWKSTKNSLALQPEALVNMCA